MRHRVSQALCISETTASDVRRLWGVPAERTWVAPLGSDFAALVPNDAPPEALASLGEGEVLSSPYNLEPRKNLAALVDALPRMREARPGLRLVLFGGAALTPEREQRFREQVSRLGLDGAVRLTGFLPADALAWLYRRSDLFVFPTLYEGFGLPALEAMAQGTCVVVRGGSAMAEVVGDAGAFADVTAPEALARACLDLLASPERRAELSAKARARARLFSVERMAERTWACYRHVLDGR